MAKPPASGPLRDLPFGRRSEPGEDQQQRQEVEAAGEDHDRAGAGDLTKDVCYDAN